MNGTEQHASLVTTQRTELDAATTPAEREAVLAKYGPQISRAHSEMEYARTPEPNWHAAPDGSQCCCTSEDRRYGCGCR